jgi:hypothetical protein
MLLNKNKSYYCGPFYFPSFLKKYLSKKYNYQCKIHDALYEEQLISRGFIDKVFLSSMLSIADTKLEKVTAYCYYIVVRLFGWISWSRYK